MYNLSYYYFISTTFILISWAVYSVIILCCAPYCVPEIIQKSKHIISTAKIKFSIPLCLLSGDFSSDFLSTHDDEASDSWSSQLIPRLSYKAQADPEGNGLASEGPESLAFIRPARSLISDEVLEALRTSDRKGRDVVVGLSNACCKWGCSKSEISSLC